MTDPRRNPDIESGNLRSSSPRLMIFGGSVALILGAIALAMGNFWVWPGAVVWGLAGLLFGRGGRKAPKENSHNKALQAKLALLDQACEDLQDQNWELREAEQKYKTLLNRQGDIILHLSKGGTLHYANDAYQLYFDGTQTDTPFRPETGENTLAISDPGDPGTEPLWERQIDTLQGLRWFRWSETLMRSANNDKELRLVIARDVTAFKKVEAASEAKSRFLATISHEMRTPLNGIIGMATLLESTTLTAEQGSYSQALRQSGTALLALVNDVLDLSRIEAGKLILTHEWVSPARLVEDVVELLAPDAQEKGLSIASWVGQSVPAKMFIDPVRVRQILVNLLGNAIKFTSEGAVNLSLECETMPVEGEEATLLLSVRDTGPGIGADIRKKLFREFEQADATRTRHHEGTGLGLAISRRLARMMDGDILLKSKPEKGSTFTLRLPAPWLDEDATSDIIAKDQGASDDFRQSHNKLDGDLLVGIDLTQADQRALFAYCRDWGMTFRSFSLQEWETKGADIAPDHLLINGADPDKATRIIEGFDPFQGGKLTRPLPRSRLILLEPGERRVIPQMRNCGISGYLVKPMRQTSLQLALLGNPANRTDRSTSADSSSEDASGVDKTSITRSSKSARILLVEDNDINALLASTLLKKAGMQVDLARSGKEALAFYQGELRFDLALLDLHMPDMDGVALFDLMSDMDASRGRLVPKVAFTADALQETREACLDHGFAAFIIKPVDPDLLIRKIHELLEQSA